MAIQLKVHASRSSQNRPPSSDAPADLQTCIKSDAYGYDCCIASETFCPTIIQSSEKEELMQEIADPGPDPGLSLAESMDEASWSADKKSCSASKLENTVVGRLRKDQPCVITAS